jgi:hypothetical protein
MRRFALTLTLAIALCAAAATVAAAAATTLSASPNPVRFGHQLTITGRHWPVNEFCHRGVRLALKSAQNSYTIGVATIGTNGRFTRHFTPRRSRIGAGRWTLIARERCESGQDGSAVFVRRTTPLRIR